MLVTRLKARSKSHCQRAWYSGRMGSRMLCSSDTPHQPYLTLSRCRSCTSVKSWMAMTKGHETADASKNPLAAMSSAAAAATLPDDCPADVEALGRGSWTLLHTMTANYPERPSVNEQEQAKTFMSLFARLYPCSHCADDFRDWMSKGHPPAVGSRSEFGLWACHAHNAVNEKLGKEAFDCSKWEERWRTGPPDGRCG